MTDIRRSRHVHVNADQPEGGICDYCDRIWPCDAIREADRADKAEAALAEHIAVEGQGGYLMYDSMRQQRDAARADAERLAEALERLTCQDDGTFNTLRDDFPDGGDIVLRWPGNRQSWENARAALAAHEKATGD
jgi:hypothetical protein